MTVSAEDKRAPMAAAPIKYAADGSVDWGNMWDSFCVLAREGGPPHRGQMLVAQQDADVLSDTYRFTVSEICRGIFEVSGLQAEAAQPGWIAVRCRSAGMAQLASRVDRSGERPGARRWHTALHPGRR